MSELLLRNGVGVDGTTIDVLCVDGIVTAVGHGLAAGDGTEVVDLDGRLLLAAAAEPHAHLDKAFLAERIENPTGDLMGAITAMQQNRHLLTVEDITERATRAALTMLANGVTAIRTHADLSVEHGMKSVEALLAVRDALADQVDIQVVALCGWPLTGVGGDPVRGLLADAIAAGVDLVGGCPHLDDEPAAANEILLSIAADAGLPVDLHTDETLNPEMLALEDLADRVIASGFPHPVTASHCVSLGVQPVEVQQRVAAKVAAAGISVVALPHTNLFLQGRDQQAAMPRGVTAVKALREAGVVVAAGADNLQDPFNPVGRADPLETAGLMIMTTHLLPGDAYAACSSQSRRAMSLPAAGPVVGAAADLVAVRAATVRDAIAWSPVDRVVVRNGRVAAPGTR
jgi:cytosine deaminase